MNKNRIRGLRWRAKRRMTTKPVSIKRTGGKSGGCALKAVELTSRDLRHVTDRDEEGAIHPDRVAEVSKGKSHPVGGDIEALQSRKAEKQIGQAANASGIRPTWAVRVVSA
jgi:hypothetical protein